MVGEGMVEGIFLTTTRNSIINNIRSRSGLKGLGILSARCLKIAVLHKRLVLPFGNPLNPEQIYQLL